MYVGLKYTSSIERNIWEENKDICIAGAFIYVNGVLSSREGQIHESVCHNIISCKPVCIHEIID